MRWIFIVLVFLNGLYLGWMLWTEGLPVTGGRDVTALIKDERDERPLALLTERLPAAHSDAPVPTIRHHDTKKADSLPQAAADSTLNPLSCFSVGPFLSTGEAEVALTSVGIMIKHGEVRSQAGHAGARHWVIIPPARSKEAALTMLHKLHAQNIDSYLVSSDELQNAISLGLFAREELAVSFRDKIRVAGYPAEMRQKESQEGGFWIYLQIEQPAEKIKNKLLVGSVNESKTKIVAVTCETFAQAR